MAAATLPGLSLNPLEAVEQLPPSASTPTVEPAHQETMASFYKRLKDAIDASKFEVVQSIESDGLYIGKRAIRGAEGQGELLNQAGTVFYHVLLYVRADGKTQSLEYGPQGAADVTFNVMDTVPCCTVLNDEAVPDPGFPLLKVKLEHLPVKDPLVRQAIAFAQSRKYHAILNNCIKTTDFLLRALTKGAIRNGPMIYDALAGKVPQQDHPMLLMFLLMTQISWFDVCDGSKMTAEFMSLQGGDSSLPPRGSLDLPQGLKSAAEDARVSEKEIDLQSVLDNIAAFQPDVVEPKDSPILNGLKD